MNKEKLNKRVLLALADILILNTVKKKPMCRQDISTFFLREFDIPINGSTLHPIIMKLKGDRLLKIKKKGTRKVFHLTPRGDRLRKDMHKTYSGIHKDVLNFIK